jgi:PKD repeat protein
VDTSRIEHRYLSGGSYTASLIVRDNGGEESSNDAEVTINVSEVTSSRELLYLTNDSMLDNDPGPSGSREVNGGRVGEWSSDPVEETRMLGSLISLRMAVTSADQGEMEYEIGLEIDGEERVFHTGSQALLGGEQTFQIDISIQELLVKAGETISLAISGTSSASDTILLLGEDGTFMEYMYYNPPNMPPEVNAGEDIEVRVDTPVTFSGTTNDPDGNIENIRWDVDDDGDYESEGVLTFEYSGYGEEGIFRAVLEVMDDDGAWSSDSLEVTVRPSDYNFPPAVTIDCERNLTGPVEISGIATDDVSVESVEVRIESSDGEVLPWTEAEGEEEWSLQWDSRAVPDGEYSILARAFDGSLYSDTDTCRVRVSNINTPPEIIGFELDPPSMIFGQEIVIMIKAEISDPDLPGDSLEVTADLGNMEGPSSLEMTDDGRGADDEDGDGIYSAVFDPPVDIQPGTYRIFVEARDSAGGIDQDFADFGVVTDILITPRISPNDPDPGEEVLIEVEIDTTLDIVIRAESDLFPNGSVTLNDQGLDGDRVLGDGIHSIRLSIDGEPGRYSVVITVEEDGSILSREEMVIRIVGSPEVETQEEQGLIWILIAGSVLIVLALVIVLMLVLGRRNKPEAPSFYDQPMVAEVVEEEVLEGELPVEGEVPEVSEDTEYGYQDSSLPPE